MSLGTGLGPHDYFVRDLAGVAGLQSWQGGAAHTPKQSLPYVGVNTRADNPFLFGVDWPAGTMMVHPLPDRYVVLGWRSPIDGDVAITGSVTDRHATCGDGVRWSVDHGAATLASGSLDNGGAQSLRDGAGGGGLASVHVDFGDWLYLVIDPKTSYVCDSTGLNVKISEVPEAAQETTPGESCTALARLTAGQAAGDAPATEQAQASGGRQGEASPGPCRSAVFLGGQNALPSRDF